VALAGRLPSPRRAALSTLRDPNDGRVLDQAIAVWFPAPASFTGEDQVELSLHGGLAVVQGIIGVLSRLGLRPAEPGEFTRRAFEHGKLDLTKAEAIADLIDAETQAQRDQAIAQLGGGLGRRQDAWRTVLVQASAMLEADIDFPDEEIPSGLEGVARRLLTDLLKDLDAAIVDDRGKIIRDGYRIALIGAPNAGKSSVLNALLKRDAAIVTEIAGTTRDVIEADLAMDGFSVIVADTAGMRNSDDRIEIEGIRRARIWTETAALRVLVIDQAANNETWRLAADMLASGDMMFVNKADLPRSVATDAAMQWAVTSGVTPIFGQADVGDIAELLVALSHKVSSDLTGAEFPAVTRERHRAILGQTRDHVQRALNQAPTVEALAEDVRLAARALAQLVGEIGSEDVLDEVFSTFCIGK
jgi:tRNA modification GTPase